MAILTITFENPLVVCGRFLGGYYIGVTLPKNPRKKIKVYSLPISELSGLLDMLLSMEDKHLDNIFRINSKWLNELIAIHIANPDYEHLLYDTYLLACKSPKLKALWVLVNNPIPKLTDLPF